MKSTASALALLACSLWTVQAQSVSTGDFIRALPLIGLTICPSDGDIVVFSDTAEQALPKDTKSRIQDAMTVKLRAYRMLSTSEDCQKLSSKTYVRASITLTQPIDLKYRAYSVELYANTTGVMKFYASATVWDDTTTVVSSKGTADIADGMVSIIKESMDRLAADYALANR